MSFFDLSFRGGTANPVGMEKASSRARRADPVYFSKQVLGARRFFLEMDTLDHARGVVNSAGCEQCGPDYDLHRSGFPYYSVEFVSRGTGVLHVGKNEYALERGVVYCYGRRTEHRIRAISGMVKYFVAFSGRAARALLRECQLLPGAVVQVTRPDQIEQILDDLVEHGLGDHRNRNRLCDVALQYLLMKVADLAVPHGQIATPAYATYRRCRDFIEENFAATSSLGEVAETCHVDASYLCRLFQRFGRQSPSQYLQRLRMNRAADLLQHSGRMVKDIAAELGFSDPYNFSRAVKRAFGVTPAKLVKSGRFLTPKSVSEG